MAYLQGRQPCFDQKKATRPEENGELQKRSAQRLDLAGGLVRRMASKLYLREAKVEMGRTEYQEISQHSG